MRSDIHIRNDIRKIAGTDKLEGFIPGVFECTLLKINKSKINEDGWYIRIDSTGEKVWAYYTFDFGDEFIPLGNENENLVNLKEKIKVLAMQDGNKKDWRIIKGSDILNIKDLGVRVLRVGNSEIRISNEKIEISTPELFVNGVKY